MSIESKQEPKANLPQQITPIYEETVEAALRHVAFETDVTVKDIARSIMKAESTTYKKLDGQQSFTIAEFCTIVRLSVAKGAPQLIDLMLPDGYTVVPPCEAIGGTLEEEVTELISDTGRVVTSARSGKRREAESASAEVIADATAIAKRVKGAPR